MARLHAAMGVLALIIGVVSALGGIWWTTVSMALALVLSILGHRAARRGRAHDGTAPGPGGSSSGRQAAS